MLCSPPQFSLLSVCAIFSPLALPLLALPPAALGTALVLLALLALWHFFLGTGTSHPGGPRAHRILREPQWADKTWPAPEGWWCEVAEASHEATHRSLASGQTLTGEAAGRQTWHHAGAGKGGKGRKGGGRGGRGGRGSEAQEEGSSHGGRGAKAAAAPSRDWGSVRGQEQQGRAAQAVSLS